MRLGMVALLCALSFCGCSKSGLQARLHLFKAEQLFWKANYQLRSQKVPFEKRRPIYEKACQEYLQAIELDTGIFNEGKFQEATQSCASADKPEIASQLEEIRWLYCQDHPKECEYGFMPSNPEISEI